LLQLIENFGNTASGANGGGDYIDPEDPPLVVEAKKRPTEATEFTYTEKDVILYNLGIGATEKELHWVFESDDRFHAIPTFGVVPQFAASGALAFDWVPNFNPVSRMYDSEPQLD
jgi:multifunctional beta-oxidation protein